MARTVVEDVDVDAAIVVVRVRPGARAARRCGRCGKRASWYDRGEGRRRWRGLDWGATRVVLEADAPRVNCRVHGPTVIAVPWARHTSGHTRAFDDMVAWLVTRMSKSAVAQLMRIAWPTVGSIVARVGADIDQRVDRLAGLRRIGIDEISYKKGRRFLTVVVDHDTGRLVWAAPGADKATLVRFFAELGPARCAHLTHVSADAAAWITPALADHCPQAVRCADPFHIVAWASHQLDVVRRRVWKAARTGPGGLGRPKAGQSTPSAGTARAVARSRWSLWKNPEDLTTHQQAKLDWIAKTQPVLYRAYLLKEGLRFAFTVGGQAGKEALARWLSWAQRCRIPEIVYLGQRVRRHRAAIDATFDHGLSNALIESVNTKIRLLTRIAFGFRKPEHLIALALLALGGHQPTLPGR